MASMTAAAVLERMRSLQVATNRAQMARARATVDLFQQFSADYEARRASDPHVTATPLTETVTETQPVTGQSASRIRGEVEQVLLVDQELPWLACHLDQGRLDLERVRPVTDALRDDLADHPAARARFGELMRRWVERAANDSPALVNKTFTQVRNHVHYLVTKVLASEVDERFRRRYRQRRVSSQATGDGMAVLLIDTDEISVTRAERHLDLLARDVRSAGDPRTLDQLRADLAVDLLCGASVGSTHTSAGWARPVINVTVPIQTLMGLSDEPGRSGESTLPASLVRHVAADPRSTWHRLLTDPSRGGVELSTQSYRPTGPIWREVVATQTTCFAPTCSRAAGDCELDHRTPWPAGPTSTDNLGPACPRHHRSKHAPGAGLTKTRDGSLRYRTRSGLTHLVTPTELPGCDDAGTGRLWQRLLEIQPNPADLSEALDQIAHHRHVVAVNEHSAEVLGQREDPGWWDVPPAGPELSTLVG
ncbi:MAG: HNH endonuclease signature motif containing protein [Nocardioides sp.]